MKDIHTPKNHYIMPTEGFEFSHPFLIFFRILVKLEILQLGNLGTQAGSISLFFLICCLVSPECWPVTGIRLVAADDRFRMHAVVGYDLITSVHENRKGDVTMWLRICLRKMMIGRGYLQPLIT